MRRKIIQVYPDYDYTIKRRREQKTKEFQKEMTVRAQIEGTISELVRFH